MLIGYARVSKTDGSQSLDLQRDPLRDPREATRRVPRREARKRRAAAAGLPPSTCCHTFRATGITARASPEAGRGPHAAGPRHFPRKGPALVIGAVDLLDLKPSPSAVRFSGRSAGAEHREGSGGTR